MKVYMTMSIIISAIAYAGKMTSAFTPRQTAIKATAGTQIMARAWFRMTSRLASSTIIPPSSPSSFKNDENDDNDNEDTSIYFRDAETLQGLQSKFLITLRDRGFLHQCSGIKELDE